MHKLDLVKRNDGDRKATLAKYYTMFDTMILSLSVAFVNLLPFDFLKDHFVFINLFFIVPLFIVFALKNKYGHKHQVEDYFTHKFNESETLIRFVEER